MELKVNDVQLPAPITFNYEELKAELTTRVNAYETTVYTEEQIKSAKDDRANLNKLKKALNDERIRREKEYMAPFAEFKAQIAELCAIIDKASSAVDAQVKAFEDRQKAEKQEKILAYKADAELLNAEKLQGIQVPFSDKWLNASVSWKSIEDDINAAIERIASDLATLSTLPEFGFEAVQVYKNTLDINKSIAEAQRMSQIARAKAEHEAEVARQKAEAEAKAKQAPVPATDDIPEQMSIEDIAVPTEPERQWLSFRAFLTVEDAYALKTFFESRNIVFSKID